MPITASPVPQPTTDFGRLASFRGWAPVGRPDFSEIAQPSGRDALLLASARFGWPLEGADVYLEAGWQWGYVSWSSAWIRREGRNA